MSFAFGFAGDDISDSDEAEAEVEDDRGVATGVGALSLGNQHDSTSFARQSKPPETTAPLAPARLEDLDAMLTTLPSSIAYATTLLDAPRSGRRLLVPRRVLFDVRLQLMAETDVDLEEVNSTSATPNPDSVYEASHNGEASNEETLSETDQLSLSRGLGASDLERGVYEGGFKSWEGAADLALLLLDGHVCECADIDVGDDCASAHPEARHSGRVVELGCGTALPALVCFAAALEGGHPLALSLADYNASVLRLVTLPNVLLTWALARAPASAFSPAPPRIVSVGDNGESSRVEDGDGELEVTPELLTEFRATLSRLNIDLTFVSGAWSPALVQIVADGVLLDGAADHSQWQGLLVLAAETLYEPAALPAFVDVLADLPERSRSRGRPSTALVAAKRLYFGVGGGVDDFVAALSSKTPRARVRDAGRGSGVAGCDVDLVDAGETGGVGRWIGEVTLDHGR